MKPLETTLALTLALATTSAAQLCPAPDGLDGPCCAPANPMLPAFPPITTPASTICYEACVPQPKECARVELGLPMPTDCTAFDVDYKLLDCNTGAEILSGVVHLDYTRTWREVQSGPAGGQQQLQVWRFLAKGDLSGTPEEGENCPVPPSLNTYDSAFYYGYVDYVKNCQTQEFRAASVLFHGCDAFVHDPLLSDKPGNFNPETSYAIVMPDTPANPFQPALMGAPGGVLNEEAMRTVRSLSGMPICRTEEDLGFGQLVPLGNACLCPLGFAAPQVTASAMAGQGTCPDPLGNPSRFQSLNLFGNTPWLELVSHSIGHWTTNLSYPGPEQAWVSEGLFSYHDACATAPGQFSGDSIDLFYGATTKDGFPAFQIGDDLGGGGQQLPDAFVDLASNFSHKLGLGNPVQFPILGSVRPTDHLIYVNAN